MPTWAMMVFQDSASPSMQSLIFLHDLGMMIITLITVLVLMTMTFICVYRLTNRFLMQDQTIEIIWTTAPVIILLMIALPSLKTLYTLDNTLNPNITVKVMGHQWYWSYEYSDLPNTQFDSYMTSAAGSNFTNNRLLDTDNALTLPTKSQIRVVASSSDVIHAWTVPALGIKSDAVPGRINQTMFMMNRSGNFYGQCSEICGANHSFMPIKISAVPMKYFINWLTYL